MFRFRLVLTALLAALPLSTAGAQEDEAPRGTRAQPPDQPPGSQEGLEGNTRSPENPPGTSSPGEREGAVGGREATGQPGTMGTEAQAEQQGLTPPVPPVAQPMVPQEPPQPQVTEPGGPQETPQPQVAEPAAPEGTETQPDRGLLAQPQPSQPGGGTARGGGTATGGTTRPVGSPPPPSEQVQAMVAPEPELVARGKVASEQIEATEVALAAGRVDDALLSLEQANQILADLYTTSRGARLAMELAETAAILQLPSGAVVDLRPLVAQVDEVSALVSPEVVARVQVAARAQKSQKSQEAAAALLEARQTLMADLGLDSIEEAFARSRAAAAELEEGRPELARSLLGRTRPVLARWQAEAPLVPIRLNLRAAARAAENRNWAQAEVWVNRAAAELRIVQADAPAALSRQLAPLAGQLSWIQERLAAGKQPGPRQFRLLAKSAAATPAG